MTNHGIEFAGEQKKKRYKRKQKNKKRKKKMGLRETVYQKKKKMGVMTNHGIEFTKKKMGLRESVYQISQQKEKKKDGGYDEPWNRIY